MASNGPRHFVAVYPSPQAVADLRGVVDGLRVSRANAPGHSTRLTSPEKWHITLRFLGEVPESRLPRACVVLRDVAAAATPLRLCVAGGGSFGSLRDPIVWAGIGGEVDSLKRLAVLLQRALRRARLPVDERPPRPHLTLARPGLRVPAEEIAADLDTLNAYEGPLWTAEELLLVASSDEQTPTGPQPRYTVIETARLGGRPT